MVAWNKRSESTSSFGMKVVRHMLEFLLFSVFIQEGVRTNLTMEGRRSELPVCRGFRRIDAESSGPYGIEQVLPKTWMGRLNLLDRTPDAPGYSGSGPLGRINQFP